MALRSHTATENGLENVIAVKGSNKLLTNRSVLGDLCNKQQKLLNAYQNLKSVHASHTKEEKLQTINESKELKLESVLQDKKVKVVHKLPAGVEDIDKDDGDNIFLLPEYVNDIYCFLRKLEDKYEIREHFLGNSNISSRMRAVLVDWLVEVQVQYQLMQESLHMSIGLLDRFLQETPHVPKDKFQLVGITCLFIACKFEEMYPPELCDFVYVTDSAYTFAEVLSMEINILDKLSFSLGRPISLVFLRRFSKAAKAQPVHHSFGKYFIELSFLEYSLVHIKPSLIAATALYLSYCFVGELCSIGPGIWTPTLAYYTSYSYFDLLPVITPFACVIKKALKSKYQAVPNKYSTSKNLEISRKPCLAENSPVFLKLQSLCLLKPE